MFRYHINQLVTVTRYRDVEDGNIKSGMNARVLSRRVIDGRYECLIENDEFEGWADERFLEPRSDLTVL